jgi:hypothetical protein
MIEGLRLGNIMVDCGDERALHAFYHKLLGWEKGELYGRPALRNGSGIVILFAQEEDYLPPVWPEGNGAQQKQMHFDFQVPNVAAAVEYAISLGAVKAADQFGENEFVTMIDPAGHPFCLCAEGNPA